MEETSKSVELPENIRNEMMSLFQDQAHIMDTMSKLQEFMKNRTIMAQALSQQQQQQQSANKSNTRKKLDNGPQLADDYAFPKEQVAPVTAQLIEKGGQELGKDDNNEIIRVVLNEMIAAKMYFVTII